MINVRNGCWETNSSSYHQLAIHDKYSQTRYPAELTIRITDFDLDHTDEWSSQYKLDVLTSALSHAEGIQAINGIVQIMDLCKEIGIKVDFDTRSFATDKNYLTTGVDDDLVELTEPTNRELLVSYLFDPKSRIVSCDADYRDTAAEKRGFIDEKDRFTGVPIEMAKHYTIFEEWY